MLCGCCCFPTDECCDLYVSVVLDPLHIETSSLCYRAPWHGHQNSALHRLDQRDSLVHRLAPARHTPALLSARTSFFEIGELPQVVDGVEVSDLHEPGTHTLHDFFPGTQTSAPVCLPFQEVARVQGVGTELKDTAKLARSSRGPEGEFLHQRRLLRVDQRLELAVEFGEVGVVLNGVERSVVSFVTLVLPDVNCDRPISKQSRMKEQPPDRRTKGIAVANLGSPTSHQMNLILGHVGHARVPGTNELDILVDLVGLDLVQDDAVDVFSSGKNLAEAALNLFVHLTALLGAVDQVGEAATLLAIFWLVACF